MSSSERRANLSLGRIVTGQKRKYSAINVCSLLLPFQGGLGAWLSVAAEKKR